MDSKKCRLTFVARFKQLQHGRGGVLRLNNRIGAVTIEAFAGSHTPRLVATQNVVVRVSPLATPQLTTPNLSGGGWCYR